MEIRKCREEDFPGIRILIAEFYDEALKVYGVKLDSEVVDAAIRAHRHRTLVLIIDGEIVGVIAGRVIKAPLNDAPIYQETVWFVSKKHRRHGVKLLRALESECKSEGICMIIMIAMGSSMKEKLDRFYKVMGYRELETHYLKLLR